MNGLPLAIYLATIAASPAFAQTAADWPVLGFSHALIFDPKTRTVLLDGGMDSAGQALGGILWRLDPDKGTWQKVYVPIAPKDAEGFSVSIDTTDDAAYFIGGSYAVGSRSRNETWRLDLANASWTAVETNNALPSRGGHGAAYDPATQTIYVTGGWNGGWGPNSTFNDTWKLDLASRQWQQIISTASPAVVPPPAQGLTSYFDVKNRRLYRLDQSSLDLWWQDITTGDWHHFADKNVPPKQRGPQTVIDNAGNALYLFSSRWPANYGLRTLEGAWKFDGDTQRWNQIRSSDEPHGLWDASAFDPLARIVYLIGAQDSGSPVEVWAFSLDSSTWRKLDNTGRAVPLSGVYGVQYAAAYDPLDKRLFLVGSPGQSAAVLETWEYSIDARKWKQHLPEPPIDMPPRFDHNTVLDSKHHMLYVIGGRNRIENTYSDTWRFDLNRHEWFPIQSEAPLPPISGAVTLENPRTDQVLLIGGSEQSNVYRDVWTLDESSGGWKNIGKAPEPVVLDLGLDSTEHSLYAIGGNYLHISTGVMRFDLNRESWEQIPISNDPPPQPWLSTFPDPLHNRLIVLSANIIKGFDFGVIPHPDRIGNISGVWALDLKKHSWGKISNSQTPEGVTWRMAQYDASSERVIVAGGKFSIGLRDEKDDPGNPPWDQLWAFDLRTKRWQQFHPKSVPTDRINSSVTVVPDEHALYLLGGMPDPGDTSSVPEMPAVGDFWRLDMRLGQWNEITNGARPPARLENTATYDPKNASIYIVGGMNDLQPLNDVWRFDLKTQRWINLTP